MRALRDDSPLVGMDATSAYAELHKADWVPTHYDDTIYKEGGYDQFIWSIQRPVLAEAIQALTAAHRDLQYLDFACGTGRIIAAVEGIVGNSTGVDTSSQMLHYAEAKVRRSVLVCGDILSCPSIIEPEYDVITAFRFFLNTESSLRRSVMFALAARLRGPDSRLIFNIHGSNRSILMATSAYRRLRGWGPATTMSYREVTDLVEQAGLEVEHCYGFGLAPRRLYRSSLAGIVRRLDRWAAHRSVLAGISQDLLLICRPRGNPASSGGTDVARRTV